MSQLRDLQKLRNTRNNLPSKRTSDFHLVELKLRNNPHKKKQPYQNNQSITARERSNKNSEIRRQHYQHDQFAKYLQQKEIKFQRECQLQLPRTSEKSSHKRGNSFGIGSTHYDSRSRQLPSPGLSVYNFQLKMVNLQPQGRTSQVIKKSNGMISRRQKIPSLQITKNPENRKEQRKPRENPIIKTIEKVYNKNLFDILYPIGKGGFGKVWKVKDKQTGEVFAMKQMQKAKVIKKQSIDSVMNQRTLLASLHHPFLVNMKYCFQDRENLYLVMDYLNGGDLRYHIGCRGKFSQKQTKFFLANMIIGLQYLHKNKIIHRDLKPQNYVFESNGYLRVTDLGVSRLVRQDNHKDTSGTPGYMSPEVICHKNHTYAADYFALGVMGYEFMIGHRPYGGRNRKQIRQHMMTKQVQIRLDQLPYRWSPKAGDFINKLLIRNPQHRLGWNGIQQLKNHPWMVDVDWQAIKQKKETSPFIPESIEDNYEDYKEQISEDTIDEDAQQTRLLLRDPKVQSLFDAYNSNKNKKKYSLRTTNYTDHEPLPFKSSGK